MSLKKFKYYIKLPKSILDLQLSTAHFTVYCYLYSVVSSAKGDTVVINLRTIAKKCGLCDKHYASRLTDDLRERGLIEKTDRRNVFTELPQASAYKIVDYTELKEDYFFLPVEFFKLKLPPKCFALAAYFCCKASGGEAYPSLAQISGETGMSKTTVIKYISVLMKKGVIAKQNYMRLDNCYGHNRYYLMFAVARKIGEKYARKLKIFVESKILNHASIKIVKALIAGKKEYYRHIENITAPTSGGVRWYSGATPEYDEPPVFVKRKQPSWWEYFLFSLDFFIGRPFFTTILLYY